MKKAQILSSWKIENNQYKPKLVDLLQPGDSLMDVTGEPVTPNSPLICEVWGQATIEAARNHLDYGDGSILLEWEESNGQP